MYFTKFCIGNFAYREFFCFAILVNSEKLFFFEKKKFKIKKFQYIFFSWKENFLNKVPKKIFFRKNISKLTFLQKNFTKIFLKNWKKKF